MSRSTHAFSPKLRIKNAPPVEVTDPEMDILHALHRYRLLEWRQILDLFGSSVPDIKHLAERIERLYQNAYLEDVPRPLYPSEAERGHVYRLGVAGAHLLAGQLSIPFPAFPYWRKGDDKDSRQTQVSALF